MPLPSHIRAERMDGRAESDWIITGKVGGQRIEVARVPFKGPDYDHAALAVVMAAGERMLVALEALVDEADRIGNALSARGQGATILGMRCRQARAAIQSATTIPTTDEGGR